jgi:hypothetical protein
MMFPLFADPGDEHDGVVDAQRDQEDECVERNAVADFIRPEEHIEQEDRQP